MSRSKVYGALSFIAVLQDGTGFLGPAALQAGGDRSPAAGSLGTGGGVKRASCPNLGVALSQTSLVRGERGKVKDCPFVPAKGWFVESWDDAIVS